MTPRQVDELDPAEYAAMVRYAVRQQQDEERERRKAARRNR